jgi:hypothetical protein
MRALLVSFGLLLSHLSWAQTSADPIRVYADSAVKLIAENDEKALFELFAPSIRASYPRDELVKPLSQIREQHGRILSYEYRQRMTGQTQFSNRVVPHLAYWYATVTEKGAPNAFLTLKLTEEGGRLYIAGFDVEEVDDPIPSFLQPRAK